MSSNQWQAAIRTAIENGINRDNPQWQLQVTTQIGGGGPVLKAVATSEQFSGESPLDLAIERTEQGGVMVTEGQPDWWNGLPIGCASN